MPDRESIIEAAAAIGSVLFMLATMVYIGRTYGTSVSLGEDGAPMLIVAIVVFILFVTVLGVVLAYVTSEPASDETAEAAT